MWSNHRNVAFLLVALLLVYETSSFSSPSLRSTELRLNSRRFSHAHPGHLYPLLPQETRRSRLVVLVSRMSNDEVNARPEIESKAPSDKDINGERKKSTLPSMKKLLIFTATTIVIWLSEPLLSLVDTTVVSLTSTASSAATTKSVPAILQIAALGPATTLYDSQIYATYFLAIATTNQLAPMLAKKKWNELRQRTSVLMGLSVLLGSLIMVVNFTFGRSILQQMVGSLTEPGIVPMATNYVLIRSLVAPCAITEFVAQAFCLTNFDTKTPAIAVLVASIVNIVGDLALAPKWGIQGAAMATALASLSSSAILTNKVRRTVLDWKRKEEKQHQAATSGLVDEKNIEQFEAVEDIPFWSLPDKKALLDLCRLGGPVFLAMMSGMACYSVMTLKATNFGIVNLATHNIMMSIFFFFTCFGDSLGQAAQTFFPQVAKEERRTLVKQLLGVSAIVGVINFVFSNFILTRMGRFLTKEAAIIEMMRRFAHYVSFSALIHPFIMFMEGVTLVKRDLKFLVGLYFSTLGMRLIQFAIRRWTRSMEEQKVQTS
eukprot:scaffold19424_cov142-Cylindrotheca_fusiformis.AAC.7